MMNRAFRGFSLVLLAVASWAATAGTTWAQVPLEEPVAKSYVLPYIMVILVLALALAIVLRPPGRATEVRLKKSD